MSIPESGMQQRTVCQIVDPDGTPYKAVFTENIWLTHAFSEVTDNNAITPYFTGKAYFAELIEAFANAQESIYIAGWQVNWDAQLAPKVRLYDCLLAAAQRGVNIYVMPWDDSAPVQTYDDQTRTVLLNINRVVGSEQVFVTLAGSRADAARAFFSHHQKQVVIDQRIGFVGGLDLAYGRYDDEHYDLRADADGREGMNRYNGCVPQLGHLGWENLINPDKKEFRIEKHHYQTPYDAGSPMSVGDLKPNSAGPDASRQPRMPWQDIHLRIEGSAVSSLTRNFVLRWNGLRKAPSAGQPLLPPAPAPASYPAKGTCSVQVLRSAPAAMQDKEAQTPLRRDSNQKTLPQEDIYEAMALLIEKAKDYIYIEQQFFVSDFGKEHIEGMDKKKDKPYEPDKMTEPSLTIAKNAGMGPLATRAIPTDSKAKIENYISKRLIERIGLAIMTKTRFHVYIVLPVHPEGGGLDNPAIATQIHWTQQSITFGTQSLLNGIRAYLKMKTLRDNNRLPLVACAAVLGKELDAVQQLVSDSTFDDIKPTDEQCFEYVTLLNLRNWANLYGNYVTEQIYVHSKMMIVDDRYALIGSANINDRSLLGARDSELAVLIMDTDVERRDYRNTGSPQPTRAFARELRRGVWSKLFGLTSGVRPAEELREAIETPGCPNTWRKIQQVAQRNTAHYEAVFKYIPKSLWVHKAKSERFPASIWPVINAEVRQQVLRSKNQKENKQLDFAIMKKDLMPFEPDFWKFPPYNISQVKRLEDVRGFITTYPVHWTEGENNNMQYHMALVTQREQNKPVVIPTLPSDEMTLAADGTENKDTLG
jgi:phospholipase D1/2